MQSSYRLDRNCNGGNLLKIYLHNCTIDGLCEAKLDGKSKDETEASKECYNSSVRVNTCYSPNCGTGNRDWSDCNKAMKNYSKLN